MGYPNGLPFMRNQIAKQLQEQVGGIFDSCLIVILRDFSEPIGECKVGQPNKEAIAMTHVKL